MSFDSHVTVRVPATCANLGPGFDCLGLAIALYTSYRVEFAPAAVPARPTLNIELRCAAEHARPALALPADHRNLFYASLSARLAQRGTPPLDLRVVATFDVPPERGLGSSAAAVVAGLLAAEAIADLIGPTHECAEGRRMNPRVGASDVPRQRQGGRRVNPRLSAVGDEARLRGLETGTAPEGMLLDAAVALEHGQHPDNVAAALLGELVVTARDERLDGWRAVRVPLPDDLRAVLFVPNFAMDTAQGRALLPPSYSRADAVHNVGHAALLVAALASGDHAAMGAAMDDRLHEPYRTPLFPQLPALRAAAYAAGALGVCLSGGGSSVLALASDDQAQGIADTLREAAHTLQVPGCVLVAEIDREGAEVLTPRRAGHVPPLHPTRRGGGRGEASHASAAISSPRRRALRRNALRRGFIRRSLAAPDLTPRPHGRDMSRPYSARREGARARGEAGLAATDARGGDGGARRGAWHAPSARREEDASAKRLKPRLWGVPPQNPPSRVGVQETMRDPVRVVMAGAEEDPPALYCPDCGSRFSIRHTEYRCDCGRPLEVALDDPAPERDGAAWRRLFDGRLGAPAAEDRSGVWRFRELLLTPALPQVSPVTRPEGQTNCYFVGRGAESPGHRAIGELAGLDALWVKHEGENPTGSFKDRGMTVGVSVARWLGATAVACASTGNTAASMAAYAAQAGLRALVLLPEGKVAAGKLSQALAYGAEVRQIAGDFDRAMVEVERLCRDEGIYLLNSLNPFRILGQQSLAFELAQQLGWDAPDWIALPAGNLGNTSALGAGLLRAHQLGLIARLPRIAAIQAAGANPFYQSYREGFSALRPVAAHTLATAINIGHPVSFARAREVIRATRGVVAQVSDDEIMRAKAVVDRAGIGCEPASAAAIAGLRQLVAAGTIQPHERVVAILTGHLLKDPDAVLHARRSVEEHQEEAQPC